VNLQIFIFGYLYYLFHSFIPQKLITKAAAKAATEAMIFSAYIHSEHPTPVPVPPTFQ